MSKKKNKKQVYAKYGSDIPYRPLDPDAEQEAPFDCSEEGHEPHIHYVGAYTTDNGEDIVVNQLHMPGYDEHDAAPKSGFSTMPAYNIATGWHQANLGREDQAPGYESGELMERPANHITKFKADHKYDLSTDPEEAFNLWHETCHALAGPGAIGRVTPDKERPDVFHFVYYPGRDEAPEQREEEEQEDSPPPPPSSGEMPEPGLRPGQRAYSLAFYPGKQYGDKASPSFSRYIVEGGHHDSDDAGEHLHTLADKYDLISQIHGAAKEDEDPDYWEDLFKRSHKSVNLWD